MDSASVVIAISGPGFRHQLTIETVEDLALLDLILESIRKKLEAASANSSESTGDK